MPNTDQNTGWIRKRIRLNPRDCLGVLDDSVSGIGEFAATGAVVEKEISTLGITGWTMATAGEFLNGIIPIPYDLDPKFPIGFRVYYTIEVNSLAPVVTWLLLQNTVLQGAAYVVPTAVMDTIIPAQTYPATTDFLMQRTGRAIRKKLLLVRKDIEAGAFISIKLEMDAVTNTPTDVLLMWLEMDYAVQKMIGQGSHVDQPLKVSGG